MQKKGWKKFSCGVSKDVYKIVIGSMNMHRNAKVGKQQQQPYGSFKMSRMQQKLFAYEALQQRKTINSKWYSDSYVWGIQRNKPVSDDRFSLQTMRALQKNFELQKILNWWVIRSTVPNHFFYSLTSKINRDATVFLPQKKRLMHSNPMLWKCLNRSGNCGVNFAHAKVYRSSRRVS